MAGHCSFCDKPREEVRQLVACATALICDGCVELALAYVDERFPRTGQTRAGEPRLMREPCEFCRDLMARCQVTAYGHAICDQCTDVCAALVHRD